MCMFFFFLLFRACIQVLAVLAVTLLVASGYGHPTVEEQAAAAAATASENGIGVAVAQETTSAKHGLRGWLMTAGKRHHEHVRDCKHGEGKGILAWVKNKFRPASRTSTTTGSPTTTTTTTAGKPDGYDYQSPEPVVDNNNSGNVVPPVVEPYDVEVPSENNEAEGGDAQEYEESAEPVPYPITESPSEFADPSIDLRSAQ